MILLRNRRQPSNGNDFCDLFACGFVALRALSVAYVLVRSVRACSRFAPRAKISAKIFGIKFWDAEFGCLRFVNSRRKIRTLLVLRKNLCKNLRWKGACGQNFVRPFVRARVSRHAQTSSFEKILSAGSIWLRKNVVIKKWWSDLLNKKVGFFHILQYKAIALNYV